jgi:hypothetical protein
MGRVVFGQGGLVFLRLTRSLSARLPLQPRFASDLPATRFLTATPVIDHVASAE